MSEIKVTPGSSSREVVDAQPGSQASRWSSLDQVLDCIVGMIEKSEVEEDDGTRWACYVIPAELLDGAEVSLRIEGRSNPVNLHFPLPESRREGIG